MKNKVEIKIVKKNATKIIKTSLIIEKDLQQKVNNRIVSTISGWVNEFQTAQSEQSRQSRRFIQNLGQKNSALPSQS